MQTADKWLRQCLHTRDSASLSNRLAKILAAEQSVARRLVLRHVQRTQENSWARAAGCLLGPLPAARGGLQSLRPLACVRHWNHVLVTETTRRQPPARLHGVRRILQPARRWNHQLRPGRRARLRNALRWILRGARPELTITAAPAEGPLCTRPSTELQSTVWCPDTGNLRTRAPDRKRTTET